MPGGWLYNTGDPHAADARETGCGNVPKYYRLTCEPFTVFDAHEAEASFGPQDVILKKIKYETDARISDIAGWPEWWMVEPDRNKLIDWVWSVATPTEDWEKRNPGEDWRDYFPRAQWWARPSRPNDSGARWTVVAHLWLDPSYQMVSVAGGGGPVSYDFIWVTALWSPFGRNELLSADNPAEGPRAWVEAYWP